MKIASQLRGLGQALGLAAGLTGACGGALRPSEPVPAAAFFNAPLRFEANCGQAPAPIQFLARGGAGTLLLAPTETIFATRRGDAAGDSPPRCQVRVTLIGANPGASLEGLDPASARINYLTGSDPRQWHTQIPTFARIKAAGVYPGIDLVHYGRQGQIEYDFNVRPGGDPAAIRLGFEGVEQVAIDAEGDLVVQTPAGAFHHRRPVAYQIAHGVRTGIAAGFTLSPSPSHPGSGLWVAGFELGAYNPALPLVIDPVLSFATYLGGTGDDQAYGVAVDAQGCVYVTGQTTSPDFPTAKALAPKISGQYDVFVTKFSADGQEIIYSTFVGGSANDRGFNLALDSTGAAVVAGQTSSPDFPTKNAFQPFFVGGDRDAFLFKLAPDGASFVFSTYLGGGASDDLTCVAVDRADNILAGGGTSSTNFPVLRAFQSENHGGYDAVLVRFNPAGVLNYSTYLGGSGPYDTAIGVAVDQEQCAYLTGYTSSKDFPLRNPLQAASAGGYDAFVTKFNPSGSGLVFSTLLGGGADDVGRGIAVDALGNTYVAGDTFSTNFPTVKPLQPANAGLRDVFVCKISPTGLTLLFSTFFGGSGEELAGLTVDPSGSVWLVGLTTSTNLPLASPIQDRFGGGTWDAFVARLSPAGDKLAFSTYLGGAGNDQGAAIALDRTGNAYVAGASTSANLPTVKPFQSSNRGGLYDAFVMRISEPAPSLPPPATVAPLPAPPVSSVAPTHRQTEVAAAKPGALPVTTTAPPVAPPVAQPTAAPVASTATPPSGSTSAPPATPSTAPVVAPAASPLTAEPKPDQTSTNIAVALRELAKAIDNPSLRELATAPSVPTPATAPTNPPAAATTLPEKSLAERMDDPQLAPAPPPAGGPKSADLPPAYRSITPAPVEAKPESATPPDSSGEPQKEIKSETEALAKPAASVPAPPTAPIDAKWLQHPLINTNLVLLGDAETALPGASSYKVTPPPGWAVTGNLTVLRYGTLGGFPSTNDAPAGGRNFFAGGPDSPLSVGTQVLLVADLAPAIDASQLACTVSGLFTSTGAKRDQATLEAVFKDAEGRSLGQVTTSPVLPSDRKYQTLMVPRSAGAPIPPQTRAIEVHLVMKRVAGSYNDGYADNLSVVITPR